MSAVRRIFLVTALSTVPVAAGNLSGRVVDTAGRPVAGAQVRLEARGLATSTDAQGRFLFAGVGAGRRVRPVQAFPGAAVRAPFRIYLTAQGRVSADGRNVGPAEGEGPLPGTLAKSSAAADTLSLTRTLSRPRRLLVAPQDSSLGDIILYPEFAGTPKPYLGFDQYDFRVDGRNALVVAPKRPAPGSPWIWRTYFWNHKPRFDSLMAARGYHLAFIDAPNLYGGPPALLAMDAFHSHLTTRYGLNGKPTLVGISRGGLYAYRWAAANTGKVSALYGDAPVMDFVSWPCGCYGTGPGGAGEWAALKTAYGFASDAAAKAYAGNPYALIGTLAKARIPLIHVYGDVDALVPAKENTLRAADSARAHGWPMILLAKPGTGHVHGLSAADGGRPGQMDSLVDFVVRHTAP